MTECCNGRFQWQDLSLPQKHLGDGSVRFFRKAVRWVLRSFAQLGQYIRTSCALQRIVRAAPIRSPIEDLATTNTTQSSYCLPGRLVIIFATKRPCEKLVYARVLQDVNPLRCCRRRAGSACAR